MNVKDIIRENRLALGLTMKEVADKVGVSEATISRWESGEIANMRRGAIFALAQALSISPNKIMGWDEPVKHKSLPSDTYRYVPASVAAGSLTTIEGLTDLPLVTVPDCMLGRYARNKNILLMPVNGESMNNVICNGAIIAVLTKVELPQIRNGDIVVVSNSGDYTVKRFFNDKEHQEFIFRPDSSDMSYRDIIFSYDNCEDLQLVGKVVMYNVTL
ncbi:LexA family transcriptional regulator [uncultured Selenomonas sp.]|uniref:LexA family protein n=1 Tax=uncultured Selenomonas sp. TaxID=159275 RepID=UPI0026393993|nr:XRE family transcriptional regulator [uncultured Selenomonas sp.]